MAITIVNTPSSTEFISAHENVWLLVDSTNKNVPGFKYIFEIVKNGQVVSKLIVYPNPDGGYNYGMVDVSNIVRSFLKTPTLADLNITTPITTSFSGQQFGDEYFFTDFDVRFGEICGTTTTLNDTSGSCKVFNTYNRNRFHNSATNINVFNTNKFYSNRPNESFYYEGQPVLINIEAVRWISSEGVNLKIDSDGTQIVNYNISNFGFGYERFCLNGLTGAKIDLKVSRTSSPFTLYQTKTLYKKCSKYTPYTLFFINAYGCWDSFTFVNGEVSTDFEKKKFDIQEYKIDSQFFPLISSSLINVYNRDKVMYNEKSYTYATEFKTKMKLTSDILSTEEYRWLFELLVSPSVYIYDNTASTSDINNNNIGALYPVQITDTNYQLKNSLRSKTETVEINIEIDKQNTQYR